MKNIRACARVFVCVRVRVRVCVLTCACVGAPVLDMLLACACVFVCVQVSGRPEPRDGVLPLVRRKVAPPPASWTAPEEPAASEPLSK